MRTMLTLGNRIASRRKLMNMSQESLAENLNVTRQAVSKWESDSAIPEIDKLIALSKLFGVSVDWILGIENELGSRESFTDKQLKTVDELIANYQPPLKKRLWKNALAGIVVFCIVFSFFYLIPKTRSIINDNQVFFEQISALVNENALLQAQVAEINKLLEQQTDERQLLSDFSMEVSANEALTEIHHTLYLTPKIYQETKDAYISIRNPAANYYDLVPCTWNPHQKQYVARYSFPVADGYTHAFILMNDYGYEEENLLIRDSGFKYAETFCGFHMEPTELQYQRIQQMIATPWKISDHEYHFNTPIHTPHIFAKTAVAYREVWIKMLYNNEVIWEKSYLEEFEDLIRAGNLNAGNQSLYPKINLTLPQLSTGDELLLILTAETVNGGLKTQFYETVLDYLLVE